jgi:hypothetical protein
MRPNAAREEARDAEMTGEGRRCGKISCVRHLPRVRRYPLPPKATMSDVSGLTQTFCSVGLHQGYRRATQVLRRIRSFILIAVLTLDPPR